ncbi:FliC/FljB family flagellin [Salmonella enterica subsp. enterica serovar Newport]|nr:FliC/FljB family flagellin [Salmonella enterica subsp. enterica serovar Newport]
MAQVINTNSLSTLTQHNLNKSQSIFGTSIERLSSGLRINSAKDDAAGQALANRFTSSIRGLSQSARNANDGISVAQTTEGSLSEINNNMQRIRELAVQASNGSNSQSDLNSIQDEIKQRLDEINRVSAQTEFNGKKVLSNNEQVIIQIGAKDGETISIDLEKIDSTTLSLHNLDVTKPQAVTIQKGKNVLASITVDKSIMTATNGTSPTLANPEVGKATDGKFYIKDGTHYYNAQIDNKSGTITFDVGSKIDTASGGAAPAGYAKQNNISKEVSFSGVGLSKDESLVSYLDSSGGVVHAVKSGSVYKAATIDTKGDVTVGNTLANQPDLNSDALKKIDDALAKVDKFRSSLGAIQNRFESVVTNLGNTVNNISSARSRIQDADYATEVSDMSRAQILLQVGMSVLAQANQSTQNVLTLLR